MQGKGGTVIVKRSDWEKHRKYLEIVREYVGFLSSRVRLLATAVEKIRQDEKEEHFDGLTAEILSFDYELGRIQNSLYSLVDDMGKTCTITGRERSEGSDPEEHLFDPDNPANQKGDKP
jgi:hypothetical protein